MPAVSPQMSGASQAVSVSSSAIGSGMPSVNNLPYGQPNARDSPAQGVDSLAAYNDFTTNPLDETAVQVRLFIQRTI